MPTFPLPTPKLPNYFISSLAQTLNVGGGDTSIALGSIYTLDGQVVTTADFTTFGRGIITIDPLNLNATEFASFTGITPNTAPAGTVTGVTRGLSFKDNTQITANQKFHVVGAPVLISFGTHNIIDVVDLINASYTELFDLIESAVIAGALPASQIATGITRVKADTSYTVGNPTISITNPAVITLSNHELLSGDTVVFTTTGALPAAIISGLTYYVISTGLTSSNFEISSTFNGTAINTTGDTQSGTHTVTRTTPYASNFGDPYLPFYAVDTGTANAYVITTKGATPSYKDGMQFNVKILNTNTGVSTLNVNGLGAITIKKVITQDLTGGELLSGSTVSLIYIGGTFQIQSNSSSVPQWNLVKTNTLSAVSVPTATPTTITNFTGLTGDTDDEYMIEFEVTASADLGSGTTAAFYLTFNNDTTAVHYGYAGTVVYAAAGGTVAKYSSNAGLANMLIATADTTQAVNTVFGTIKIKASKTIAGTTRLMFSDVTTSDTGSSIGAGSRQSFGGQWIDTTNQLTSIELWCKQSTGSGKTISGKATIYKISR